jgi:DNA-binding GntR family transcriptional regulator
MTGRKQTKERTPRRADSAERAYNVIRKLVIDFRLKPDERINEVQLARQLDLSRTPVREALNRLASEGFLGFQPNRGFYFRAPEIDDLLQLFELRIIVEAGAFAHSCQRASNEDIAALEDLWKDMLARYERNDPDEILGLDEHFHVSLAALSGNDEIVALLQNLNARIRFVRRIQIQHGRSHPKMITEHTSIVEALKARDAERGGSLLKAHIALTVEDATAAMKEAVFKLYHDRSGDEDTLPEGGNRDDVPGLAM